MDTSPTIQRDEKRAPVLPCCFGCEGSAASDEKIDQPLNQDERRARMRFGIGSSAAAVALGAIMILAPSVIAGWGVLVVIAALLWFGVSHIVAGAIAYRGCPELGAIATLVSGRQVRTSCGPWERADRRRVARGTPSSRWITAADLPAFFTTGTYRNFISPSDNILALPFDFRGLSMLWHAEAKMSFNMVDGYTGRVPPDFSNWPIATAFLNSNFLPDAAEQMAACAAHYHTTAVVVSQADPDASSWDEILTPLSSEQHRIGGVNFYRLSPAALAPYRGLDSSAMARRATQLASGLLVMAANQWSLRGEDPRGLTPAKAVQAGWLKASWFLGPNTIPGWSTGGPDQSMPTTLHLRGGAWLGGTPNGDFGVGIRGSYAALEPVIAKYRATASHIYFPFPKDLLAADTPAPAPDTEALLTLIFDRHKLAQAAALAASENTSLSVGDLSR